MRQDRKLKACMEEIERAMNKYEVGGFITIADQYGGERKFINPIWSALKKEENEKKVDIIFKHREKTHHLSEHTIHMLQVIEDASIAGYKISSSLLEQIGKILSIEGKPIEI
jgi:hypothetical protein